MILCLVVISTINFSSAQVAVGFETETSFYQWNKRPIDQTSEFRSTGQVLGIGAGPKIWFGDWNSWTISLEAKANFAALSLDVQKYKGMGTLSFPIITKVNIDPTGMDGTFKIGVGGGVQWTITEIYARPKDYRTKNSFFISYIGELSIQIITDDAPIFQNSDSGPSVELFVRGGGSPKGAIIFSFGVKYNVRTHF